MALPQSIHIFRKDVLHLWPEILVVLALFVGFIFAAPSGWSGSEYAVAATLFALLLKVLMPISWLILISRLIHDESLVGDRQFWTSRPYHWGRLLLSKVLFLLAFLYLPFFLMQVYLLKHAGLHPMLVLPALGHNLLLLTVVFIIPIAAIAAVTSSFARLLLSTLGAILYLLVLIGVIGWYTFLHMQTPHLDWLLNGIFIVLPLAALLYQYRTRQTRTSRILLLATPALAGLILLLTPTTALISRAFPQYTGESAPKLSSFASQFAPPPSTGHLQTSRNQVLLRLPVRVEGMDQVSDFQIQGVRTTIDGNGVHYTSPFMQAIGTPDLNGGTPATLLPISLPLDIFNKVHNTPVDLHLQLATEHLKAGKPQTWKATLLPFSVPGNGLCTFSPDDASLPPTCRYPLALPEISFVSAPLAAGSCSMPASRPVPGRSSIGGKGTMLDFDPVITTPLTFRTGDPNPQHTYLLCPGTDLSFVNASTLPRAGLAVDLKAITLDPYAARITPPTAQPTVPQSGPQAPPPTTQD